VLAQTVPDLPKKWQVNVTATHDGLGTASKLAPHHPDHVGADAAKGWKAFTEQWTLTIVKQEGRHIQARMSNSRADNPWIGTLSADGKLLQVATPVAGFALQITGDKMSGCGSGNTGDGMSYSALCFDMTAMK
jgi:hypothetical protein